MYLRSKFTDEGQEAAIVEVLLKNFPKQLIPLIIIGVALIGGLITARYYLVPESFGKYGSSEEQTKLFDGEDAYSFHFVEEGDGPKSVHAHANNTWLTGPDRNRTYLINIFPCHTIQLQPDMLWSLSILPDGQSKVHIRWAVSIPAEILDAARDRQAHIDGVMKLLHQVNSEDLPIVENVFRTTRSPDAEQGPLSYLERNVWQFGRYLARKLCP